MTTIRHLCLGIFLMGASGSATVAAQPSLSPGEYARVMAAREALTGDNLSQADTLLRHMAARKLTPYARALVHQLWGNVWLQRNDYQQAQRLLQIAYDEKVLPEADQLNLLHALAQLDLAAERWQSGLDRMNTWMVRQAERQAQQITANDYLMVAQANAQLQRWRQVITPIQQAISRKADAPESWYQLQLAALLQDNRKPAAISLLKTLVVRFPTATRYWEQLAQLYEATVQPQAALSTLRLAYIKGLLVDERQLLRLAGALLKAGAPRQAAGILDKAMGEKRIKTDKKNLQRLAQAWLQAREYPQARPVLRRLAADYPDVKALKKLAKVNLQLKDWQAARDALTVALQQQSPAQDSGELYLLYGIASINLEAAAAARESFNKAAEYRSQAPAARQWLRYLDQLQVSS